MYPNKFLNVSRLTPLHGSLLATLLASVALLSACGGGDNSTSTPGASPSTPTTPATPTDPTTSPPPSQPAPRMRCAP